MALVAKSLSYTYGSGSAFASEALRDVSLQLEPGGLLLVVGATGSGKSTLLRLLAGLLEPTSGTVTVDDGTAARRGQVGLVFQNPEAQFFSETVLSDVAFGPRNLGSADSEGDARLALESVGMDPSVYGQRSPFTLSGGEARRVAVAGVLAMQTPYLLLDEPTAGLDRRGRRAVLAAINVAREIAGVLVVTHDPEQFFERADDVLALASGETAFSGTVSDLLAAPESYERVGLALPDILRVQLLARARGALIPSIAFEAGAAARVLAEARGVVG